MAKQLPQFYFTQVDPDYSIKGSRDPLAFQVLWQHQAKELIPYLSTVSVNIHDFQIICLAYYLYGKGAPNAFVRFFLKFEQLMGYARYDPTASNNGFNGIEGIRKRLSENSRISLSTSKDDQILSNQRAYGIWGKYNRPSRDIDFTNHQDFSTVFSKKIKEQGDEQMITKIIAKLINNDQVNLDLAEIEYFKPLLQLTKKEEEFYLETILKIESANPFQNKLYDFVTNNTLPQKFELYSFLKSFSKSLKTEDALLKEILEKIVNTEKILCPLNRIFRYLQKKPVWEKNGIQQDSFITSCKNTMNFTFYGGEEQSKSKNKLIDTLKQDNWTLVVDLVNRNKEVTEWRDGAPWITTTKDIVEVHHPEGAQDSPDFDPQVDFDNGYFIDTYIRLYRQITSR